MVAQLRCRLDRAHQGVEDVIGDPGLRGGRCSAKRLRPPARVDGSGAPGSGRTEAGCVRIVDLAPHQVDRRLGVENARSRSKPRQAVWSATACGPPEQRTRWRRPRRPRWPSSSTPARREAMVVERFTVGSFRGQVAKAHHDRAGAEGRQPRHRSDELSIGPQTGVLSCSAHPAVEDVAGPDPCTVDALARTGRVPDRVPAGVDPDVVDPSVVPEEDQVADPGLLRSDPADSARLRGGVVRQSSRRRGDRPTRCTRSSRRPAARPRRSGTACRAWTPRCAGPACRARRGAASAACGPAAVRGCAGSRTATAWGRCPAATAWVGPTRVTLAARTSTGANRRATARTGKVLDMERFLGARLRLMTCRIGNAVSPARAESLHPESLAEEARTPCWVSHARHHTSSLVFTPAT